MHAVCSPLLALSGSRAAYNFRGPMRSRDFEQRSIEIMAKHKVKSAKTMPAMIEQDNLNRCFP